MANTEPERSGSSAARRGSFALAGLVLPGVVTAAALLTMPRWVVSDRLELAVASALAIVPAVLSLRIASVASPRWTRALVLGVVSGAALVFFFLRGFTSEWLLPVQNVALVGVGHTVGSAIGRRIEHPGHALPAMVVAAAADVASVLHPSGPSHAIAASDRALSALALAAPVPGGMGFTFVLGVGDLVFAALLLGISARHHLSSNRVALLVLVGAAVAVGIASSVGAPIPALVPIGALTVAFVPELRRLAPRDRTTAWFAMVIAVAVVGGLLARARWGAP